MFDFSESDHSHWRDTNMGALRISVSPHTNAVVEGMFVDTPLEVTSPRFAAVPQFPINQCLCTNCDSYLVF